jgi:hypothetical protein
VLEPYSYSHISCVLGSTPLQPPPASIRSYRPGPDDLTVAARGRPRGSGVTPRRGQPEGAEDRLPHAAIYSPPVRDAARPTADGGLGSPAQPRLNTELVPDSELGCLEGH